MKAATVVLGLVGLLLATPTSADTRLGNANTNTTQNWSLTPIGTGQVQVVLSWTKTTARLAMVLVCGTSEPMTFGVAAGRVNRLAMLNAGAVPGVPCVVGVSALQGSSAYRIHFLRDVSQASQGEGRIPLALEVTEALPGSILGYTAERTIGQIRQLSASQ